MQTDSVSERVEIVALCYIAYLNVYFILNQVGTYFNNSSILFYFKMLWEVHRNCLAFNMVRWRSAKKNTSFFML